MSQAPAAGMIERFVSSIDGIRNWLVRTYRIALLMVKGAYLVGERRRLFFKLGDEAYQRIRSGEWSNPALESTVHSLDRLTKKIEIEEKLIRTLRFGSARPHSPQNTAVEEG